MRVALIALAAVSCGGSQAATPVVSSSPPALVASAAPTAAVTPSDSKVVPPSRLQSSYRNSCYLKSDGHVVCWGNGTVHVMGTKGMPLATPILPVTVAGIEDATAIAVASTSACALRKNGTLWCWGATALGTTKLERQKATAVTGLSGVVRLLGGETICAFESSGQLACLDIGTIRRTKLPVPAADIVDYSSGRGQACFSTRKGEVFCFGQGNRGELGGTPSESAPFVRVPKIDDAVAVYAGDGHSCAFRAAGTISCWGNGHDLPNGYVAGEYVVVTSEAPVSYVRMAGGMRFRCRLEKDAKVSCTGDNQHGQLGIGTTNSSFAPGLVAKVSEVVAISAGFDFACAARADDTVSCWGANDQGQIGDGTFADRKFATKVIGLGGSEPMPPPKPGSGPPLIVPLAASKPASWREEDSALPRRIGSRWGTHDEAPAAVGIKVALFSDRKLLLDEAHGLQAVTLPKGATWFGLDGNDAIYVGTKDSLSRAEDVDAVKKSAWSKVLAVPYAVDFVATKGLVVAAQAKTLHVSTDGKTFTAKPLKIDLSIEEIFARPDVIGVVGRDASGEKVLHLSRDQGGTFTKSSFQADRFFQIGSSIWANGCPGAVLSADGSTWKRRDSAYGGESFASWGSALGLSPMPNAFSSARASNLIEPPPPPVPAGTNVISGKPGVCGGGGGGLGMLGGGGYGNAGACSGIECMRGTIGKEARETKTEVGFFADGACARDEKKYCKDEPWIRAPHVSVGGTMIEVPAGCDPARILSAGGIGVLFCKSKSQYEVHTIDKSMKWNSEGAVSFPSAIDDVTIASDGTLVVHAVCPVKGKESEACPPALVRKPLSLGSSGAWRSTVSPRALAYRVLRGGEVLVIAQTKADDPSKFDLVIEKPNGAVVLASAIFVGEDVIELSLEPDRIVVTQRISGKQTRSYVAKDGLVPIASSAKTF